VDLGFIDEGFNEVEGIIEITGSGEIVVVGLIPSFYIKEKNFIFREDIFFLHHCVNARMCA
jgi:hypothetical protein